MAINARSNQTQPSSPACERDFDDGSHNVDLKNSAYASKHKRNHGAHRLKLLQRTRVQVLAAAALLAFLVVSFLRSRLSSSSDGPPRDLVVTGKRTYYQHVPLEYKRRFYSNTFRPTVIRAFRNRGWRKANEPEEAQFVYDKYAWESQFDQLLPWQRYSQFPDFEYWEDKDYFSEGFQKYYAQHPDEPKMLPETFLLDTKERRKAFKTRLEDQGGYDEPWVLKIPNKNNGEGITMMGPNSEELRGVFDKVQKHLKKQEDEKRKSRMVVQSYICNELQWYHSHKFDLRFYWMVASIDPMIVLYHDGYVRVGNAAYDESDWSSTRQHLTTHTFLADEEKGTMEQLRGRLREHYYEHKRELSHIALDPVTHVRNQFKASIAQMAAAFKDVTFGNDAHQRMTAENGYQMNGADFVIDNHLDVWYVEAQAGPGMAEEWDFRVDLHADLFHSMIDTVEEIQLKQETDPHANLLPLKNLGGWEVVYAGDWQYKYEGYQRPTKKAKCDLAPSVKSGSVRQKKASEPSKQR